MRKIFSVTDIECAYIARGLAIGIVIGMILDLILSYFMIMFSICGILGIASSLVYIKIKRYMNNKK